MNGFGEQSQFSHYTLTGQEGTRYENTKNILASNESVDEFEATGAVEEDEELS